MHKLLCMQLENLKLMVATGLQSKKVAIKNYQLNILFKILSKEKPMCSQHMISISASYLFFQKGFNQFNLHSLQYSKANEL